MESKSCFDLISSWQNFNLQYERDYVYVRLIWNSNSLSFQTPFFKGGGMRNKICKYLWGNPANLILQVFFEHFYT